MYPKSALFQNHISIYIYPIQSIICFGFNWHIIVKSWCDWVDGLWQPFYKFPDVVNAWYWWFRKFSSISWFRTWLKIWTRDPCSAQTRQQLSLCCLRVWYNTAAAASMQPSRSPCHIRNCWKRWWHLCASALLRLSICLQSPWPVARFQQRLWASRKWNSSPPLVRQLANKTIYLNEQT